MRRSAASFSAGLSPNTLTRSEVANSCPARMRSSVLFPAPLRPSSPVIDGLPMSAVTPARAS